MEHRGAWRRVRPGGRLEPVAKDVGDARVREADLFTEAQFIVGLDNETKDVGDARVPEADIITEAQFIVGLDNETKDVGDARVRETDLFTEAQFIVGLDNEPKETLEETYQMAWDWHGAVFISASAPRLVHPWNEQSPARTRTNSSSPVPGLDVSPHAGGTRPRGRAAAFRLTPTRLLRSARALVVHRAPRARAPARPNAPRAPRRFEPAADAL